MHRDFSLVDLEEEMKSIYIYGKCLLLGELLTLPLTAASSRLQNQYIGSESPRVVQAVQIHLSATSRRTALHRTAPILLPLVRPTMRIQSACSTLKKEQTSPKAAHPPRAINPPIVTIPLRSFLSFLPILSFSFV